MVVSVFGKTALLIRTMFTVLGSVLLSAASASCNKSRVSYLLDRGPLDGV